MATTIQIMVAGALLLAWIWVLGRPLVTGTITRSNYADLDRGVGDPLIAPTGDPLPASPEAADHEARRPSWWQSWDPEARRRQLLLATLLASFVSFFLAIAVGGRWGWVLLVMLVVLAVHLTVASIIGGRIAAEKRARNAHAARRRSANGSLVIGGPSPFGTSPEVVTAELLLGAPPEGLDGPSAFELAEGLASLLDGDEERISDDAAAVVSDLIGDTWEALDAELDEPPAVVDENEPIETVEPEAASAMAADPEPPAKAEPEADADEANADEANVVKDADEAKAEPLFTRAAKDEPARSRRRGQPIHIESQLDDDLPEAVNHP